MEPELNTTKECINTTYDQVYDYKKITKTNSIGDEFIEYFIKYKSPLYQDPMFSAPTFLGGAWKDIFTITYPDSNTGFMIENLIENNVNFNCVYSSTPLQSQIDPTTNTTTNIFVSNTPSNSNIPSTSQISNIIDSFTSTPKLLTGVVVDSKTRNPIKNAEVTYNEEKIYTNEQGVFEVEIKPVLISGIDETLDYDNNPYTYEIYQYQPDPNDTSTLQYYAKLYFNIKQPNYGKVLINDAYGIGTFFEFDTSGNKINSYVNNTTGDTNLSAKEGLIDELIYVSTYIGQPISAYSIGYPTPPTTTQEDLNFINSLNQKFPQGIPPILPDSYFLSSIQEDGYKAIYIENQVDLPNIETTTTTIKIKSSGYSLEERQLKNLDGTLDNNVGIISLVSTKADLDKEKVKNLLLEDETVEELFKEKKDFQFFQNKKLIDILNNLKSVMLPLVLTWLAEFGVTKLKDNKEQIKEKICPSIEKLNQIIKRKNSLVKQLNNTLKIIDSTLKIIGITKNFIDIITTTATSIGIAQLALPTSLPGVTAGQIQLADDTKKDFQDKAKITRNFINGLSISLNLLRIVLTQIVTYLNLLDSLIQDCYPEAEQEQLSSELVSLTQSQQQSPVVTNVNGFEMGVETEKTTSTLKRRRAIAQNKGGVVMLKGEWSFSSIDQILIDELVFYIQTNNLKAD
jgi:hypothetical protein